jgi:hypothetical protein
MMVEARAVWLRKSQASLAGTGTISTGSRIPLPSLSITLWPWPAGRIHQQVLQQGPAAKEQVGHRRTADSGLSHGVTAALCQDGEDLAQLPQDVGGHRFSALLVHGPALFVIEPLCRG